MITALVLAVFLGVFSAMMTFWRGRHFKHAIGRQNQPPKAGDMSPADYDTMLEHHRYLNIYSLVHLIGMLLMFGFWIITWLVVLDNLSQTTYLMFLIMVPIVFILQIVCNLLWMYSWYSETSKLRWSAIVNTLAMLLAAAFLWTQFFLHTFVNFPALKWAFLVFAIIFSVWWILELIYMWWGTGYMPGRRGRGNRVGSSNGRGSAY